MAECTQKGTLRMQQRTREETASEKHERKGGV